MVAAMMRSQRSRYHRPLAGVAFRGRSCCAVCCTLTPWPARGVRQPSRRCRWWCSRFSPIPMSWGRSWTTWDCRRAHPAWGRQTPSLGSSFSCRTWHRSRVRLSGVRGRKGVPSQTAGRTKKRGLLQHHPLSSDRRREIPRRGRRTRGRGMCKKGSAPPSRLARSRSPEATGRRSLWLVVEGEVRLG